MSDSEFSIRMSADEINCLVYSFLIDSGFKHSAFSLCMEGRLESSINFRKHIPRGELVDLLGKSLLYREVESHWKADHLATHCKAGFSLLDPHVCSLEPPKQQLPPLLALGYVQYPLGQSNRPNNTNDGKRKASPLSGKDVPAEKRPRRDADGMDVDPQKSLKPKPRVQGPGDETTNPKAIILLPGHKTEVFVCAFNPVQQSILATGSKDASVNLWDLPYPPPMSSPDFALAPSGPVRQLEHFGAPDQGDLTAMHWNREGTLVAMGSYDCILRVCTTSGDLYFSHPQHQGPIFAVRFSRDGRWLLTASLDATACVWDMQTKELHTQYRVHTDCCLDVDWLSDTTFASCSADRNIYIMQIGRPEPIRTLSGHENEINQIKCNSSGTHLVSCSDDTTARIWNIAGISAPDDASLDAPGLNAHPVESIVLRGHTHSVATAAWCPRHPANMSNELIATCSFDQSARIWDSVTGDCLQVFTDHKRPVYALKYNPSGRWLATGGGDGWLHIYDAQAGKLKWSWFAGFEHPGVFEIDWQSGEGLDRIALALECRSVAIIDVMKIEALQK
ncbi:WD40 repeat-like protein [Mycena rebaudengoi]|nr:WD40 repeat-like protein [Mycena rebaudengoi]